MKQVIYLAFLLFSTCAAFAQTNDSIPCTSIKIQGPRNNSVDVGSDATLNLKSFSKEYVKTHSISFVWITDNGSIIGANNKSSVRIDTKGLEGQQVKVAVMISGLAPNCPTTETVTLDVVKPKVIRTEQRVIGIPRN